jgi:hypothetical protein
MSQKIFNNIMLYILIMYIIILFYFDDDPIIILNNMFKSCNTCNIDNFKDITTFKGLKLFDYKAPSFKSTNDIEFVNYYKKIDINFSENELINFCYFLKTLISTNTYSSFSTPSETIENSFIEDEIYKIKDIILNKLNSGTMKFTNIEFETSPVYFINFNGKEVDSFIFNVVCKFGKIRIYINIDIRNDIYQNKEYIIINELKPLIDNKEKNNKKTDSVPIQSNLVSKFMDDGLVFNNMTSHQYYNLLAEKK